MVASLFAMSAIGNGQILGALNYSNSSIWDRGRAVRTGSSRTFVPRDLRQGHPPGADRRIRQADNQAASPSQCDPGWQPGAPVNGIDGNVSAIAVDGSGNVYAGGSFSVAGSIFVNHIAKWDGTSWSPLGAGVNGSVYAIAISGQDVYVGGYFTTAGGIAASGVAKWNGSEWSAVGSGPGHFVEDLAISGSVVYAGGGTGAPDHKGVVSLWDGSTWSALGPQFEGGISDIAASGNNIYASRADSSLLVKWSGSAWIDISPGSNVTAHDLAASGSTLYLVGYQYLGPTQGDAGYVGQWNGSNWTTLSSGVVFGSDRWGYVYGVAATGTDVFITGLFSSIGGTPAQGAAKWNGSNWSSLGDWQTAYGNAVAVSGDNVYFAGRFVSNTGLERRAEGIAKWNGSNWSDLGDGIYTVPNAMVSSGSEVYAAGYFTTDGGNTVDRLVKWNGSGWQPVTSSFPTGPSGWALTLRALAVSGSDFYIGGYWTSPNKQSWAGFVYKWNGSSWTELGTGMNGQVAAVITSGPDVYAGGRFTMAGGTAANRIAKWDGSAWQQLGSGMDGGVATLAISGTALYAGGYFYSAGGDPADKVAKWDGTNWSGFADGPMLAMSPDAPQTQFRAVTSIAVSGKDIYAAGGWDLSDYEDLGFVSKWNGSEWSQLVACCGFVNALTMAGDELYAGKDGWSDDAVTKWNGSTWSNIGFGANGMGSVGSIVIVDQEIFVGSGFNLGWEYSFVSGNFEGGFSTAGCHVSANFARYSRPAFSISGRVTSPTGLGLRNAVVTLTDSVGNRRSVLTSTLGFYAFADIPSGENVRISVSSRRYRFDPVNRTVVENLSDVDFVGVE